MLKRLLLIGITAAFFNSANAGIAVLNENKELMRGGETVMTLCVEGYVVFFIRDPGNRNTAFQLIDSNSKPLKCDPCGLGIRSTEPQMSDEEYCRLIKELLVDE